MYDLLSSDNRSVGVTNMNEHSSRSHSIFTITLESRLLQEEEEVGETVTYSRLVSPSGPKLELRLAVWMALITGND